MNTFFIVQHIKKQTIVEFRTSTLLDPAQLEHISKSLFHLVDVEDRRVLMLDFSKVQFISSQAIGLLMSLHKKLGDRPNGKLILCGVGPRLSELLKITKLDRLLNIHPTQRDATHELEKPL